MTRDDAILSLEYCVTVNAKAALRRIRPTLRDFLADEFKQTAWLAAIDAVDRFDSGRGVRLQAFADQKIRWAIADYLRSIDELSRPERRRRKASDQKGPVTITSFDLDRFTSTDEQQRVEAFIDCQTIRKRLRRDDAVFIEAVYFREVPARRIAQIWGVHETQVCHVRKQVLERIRALVA